MLIRVATLTGTLWNGPRIQRTRIDAILKVGATDSCAHRLSPVIIRHLQADAGTWWDSSKMAASRDPQVQMSQIQRQIQQDWANREYIEVITCSIKKIADFLNSFGKYIFWNW